MKFKYVLENQWWQEIFILVFSFILFTLNDWILILSWKGFFSGLVYFFILYVHAQINRFFLLPVLLKEQKPMLYLLLTALLILIFSVILYETSTEILYKNCFLYKSSYQKTYPFQLSTLTGTLVCILGSTLILEHYREQKKNTSKTLLYNEAQLSALKEQLNPHFLFNTFNTLYGISLKYPEQTSDMIMHVSQLMRYQVESSSKEYVSIDDEVSFISSYIQLEKERVGYRCKITYTANLDSERQYKIAPMLLISFVENAFKHGACTIEDCFVTIDIMIKDNKLLLNISNSIPAKKRDVVSTKIGLKNTQKRLEIIYPERHKLEIKPTKTVFNVNLEIDLN
jgi:sensor histidine kinase YesM